MANDQSGVQGKGAESRVLALGSFPVPRGTDKTTFDSAVSLNDYDVVFWDPAEATAAIGTPPPGGVSIPVNDPTFQALHRHIQARKVQMNQLLARGGTLVILVSRRIELTYMRRAGEATQRRSAWDACPVPLGPIQAGEGKAYAPTRPVGRLGSFLVAWKGAAHYSASFNLTEWDPDWVSIAVTRTPDLSVAAERQLPSGGTVVLLPFLNLFPSKSPEGRVERPDLLAARLWEELVDAVKPLRAPEPEVAPAWISEYGSDGEFALRDQEEAQAEAIRKAEAELVRIRGDLAVHEELKPLLYASGTELEEVAALALQRLGGELLAVAEGHEDARVRYDGFVAICEVKGVSKGATLDHARQLENWATDRDTPEENKPILIVNGFRDLSPNERVDEVFSPRVREFSTPRGHLLMTATQLFVMSIEASETPERLPALVQLLRTTNGVLENFNIEQHRRSQGAGGTVLETTPAQTTSS